MTRFTTSSRLFLLCLVGICGFYILIMIITYQQAPSPQIVVSCDIRCEVKNIEPVQAIKTQIIETPELRGEYVPRGRQLERLLQVENECDARQLSRFRPRALYTEMYVCDEYRFIYALVAKVACTTWKSLLLDLVAKTRNITLKIPDVVTNILTTDVYLPRLHILNKTRQHHILKKYFKFTFVREPLERLVSAYQDKFGDRRKTWFAKLYGREIIKTYRQNATASELESGKGVTFEEFVQFVVDFVTKKKENPIDLDWHWRPQHLVVQACGVSYDFIGKFEDLSGDADQVLKLLGVDGMVKFPQKSVGRTSGSTSVDLVRTMFAKIPRANINALRDIYSLDYKLFNYTFPVL